MIQHGTNIKVTVMPQAAARMGDVIQMFLGRSYAAFLKNNRKDVVSEYLNGSLIVVTSVADGQTIQIALLRQEIPDLPPKAQSQLKKDLATPAQVGTFSVNADVVPVEIIKQGHQMTFEDGQRRAKPLPRMWD